MKAFLALQNGEVFEGVSIGATGETIGEIVFDTGMSGYQEVLTDPSFVGQIITMTYPLIGNYGINSQDSEAKKPSCKGFVVHEVCDKPSNFRCEDTIDQYLKDHNIVGIQGIDTRKLTKVIRNAGTMNAIISTDQNFRFEDHKDKIINYKIINPVKQVSTRENIYYKPENSNGLRIAVIDLGLKQNIVRSLLKRGCEVVVVPDDITYEQISKLNPDGIMLSNGPGDPTHCSDILPNIKQIYDSGIPIFAICLGHQLLALANGGTTSKLKFGHRGGNHPVKDLNKDRVYITSQNHGYAVDMENLTKNAQLTHVNMNDNTVEGIKYLDKPVTSVQFHPEAAPGPEDTAYLFDEFLETVKSYKKK